MRITAYLILPVLLASCGVVPVERVEYTRVTVMPTTTVYEIPTAYYSYGYDYDTDPIDDITSTTVEYY